MGAGRELETGFGGGGGNEPRLGGRMPAGEAVRSKPSRLAALRTLLERAGRPPFSFPRSLCLLSSPRFPSYALGRHCETFRGCLEDPQPPPRALAPCPRALLRLG